MSREIKLMYAQWHYLTVITSFSLAIQCSSNADPSRIPILFPVKSCQSNSVFSFFTTKTVRTGLLYGSVNLKTRSLSYVWMYPGANWKETRNVIILCFLYNIAGRLCCVLLPLNLRGHFQTTLTTIMIQRHTTYWSSSEKLSLTKYTKLSNKWTISTGYFNLLITTHENCIPGIFSCLHCNFHQQNHPIPVSCWPLVVTSELGHTHLVAYNGPVFVESWLVYADVDSLLDTPLKPTWFPIQMLIFSRSALCL